MSERGTKGEEANEAREPDRWTVSSPPSCSRRASRAGSGKAKQLAEFDGSPLVGRAVAVLERAPVGEIVVVVGHRAAAGQRERAPRGPELWISHQPGLRRGGSGLRSRAGASRALSRDSRAVVVCLADQPFVTEELIGRIVSRYRQTGADVVACLCEGLVTRARALQQRLHGETGCSLQRRQGRASSSSRSIRASEEGRGRAPTSLLDVDTEDDLERARSILGDGHVRKGTRAREADGP